MLRITSSLLLLFFVTVGISLGQNIDKNTNSYTYTRMPSHPFPSSVQEYHVETELYTTPGESKYEIDKRIKGAIKIPRLTESTEHQGARFLVRLEGYTRTEIELNETSRKEKRGDEEISVPYYYYSFRYKYPIYFEVSLPDDANPIDKAYLVDASSTSYKSPEYKSSGQLAKWWSDNRSRVEAGLRTDILKAGVKRLQKRVNDKFAFTQVNEQVDFFTVKKFKGMDYTDVSNAYATASEAIAAIEPSDRVFSETFRTKMQSAIEQWENILTEQDLESRKARINKKVAERMYRNIFQAFIMMDAFAEANATKERAESMIKNAIPAALENTLKDRQHRYEANINLEEQIAEN